MKPGAQLSPPKFKVRVLALLVDYSVILGWMAVLAVVTLIAAAISGELFNWLTLGTAGAQLLGFMVLVLPVGIYLYACEASARQATVGKRVMGLRVVNAAGQTRPSRRRIAVRTIVKLLPWEFAHFGVWNAIAIGTSGSSTLPPWLLTVLVISDLLPLAYVLIVAFQRDRRGPHDLIAGTKVVVSPDHFAARVKG